MSSVNAETFLNTLTLGDIYGRDNNNPKRVKISWSEYKTLGDHSLPSTERTAYRRQLMAQKGMESIGLTDRGMINCYVSEFSTTPHLSYWVPHINERAAILGIADSVSSGRKPRILEVGSGSGLTALTLGIDNQAEILGIDTDPLEYRADKLPKPPANVRLEVADVWDVAEYFGPRFSSSVAEDRRKRLRTLRDDPSPIMFNHFFGLYEGEPNGQANEVAALQESTKLKNADSPVDLVLCSFMAQGEGNLNELAQVLK